MQAKVEDQLSELPIEILMHIMTFLELRDLTTLELVCKDWMNLASSDIVWKTATGLTKKRLFKSRLIHDFNLASSYAISLYKSIRALPTF